MPSSGGVAETTNRIPCADVRYSADVLFSLSPAGQHLLPGITTDLGELVADDCRRETPFPKEPGELVKAAVWCV